MVAALWPLRWCCYTLLVSLVADVRAADIPLKATPLEIPATATPADLAFPLRASVPLARGWLKANELDRLAVVEAGKTSGLVPAQFEPAMSWPDGSIAVLHVPFVARWDGGAARKYLLVHSAKSPPKQPEVPPAETDFVQELLRSGPLLVDSRGIEFRARWDEEAAKNLRAERGPAVSRVELSGWYQSERKVVAPLAKFWLLAERYAAAPRIITIDLATTFADFDEAGIHQLGFEMPNLPPGTIVLTRQFEAKAPFRVDKTGDGFTVWQWPGDRAPTNRDDVSLERLAAFACFRESPDGVLWSRLASEYVAGLQRVNASGETEECDWRYAASSRLSGVSMRLKFAIVLPPDGNPQAGEVNPDDAKALQTLFEHAPVPLPSAAHIAASGLFGPVAAPGKDFADIEQTIRGGLIGHMEGPSKRYGYRGWHIFGCTFHDELMQLKRPRYHRVWNNNHYGHLASLWQEVWRADPRDRTELLYWARAATDHWGSVSLCRYDSKRGVVSGRRTPVGSFAVTPGATVAWRDLGNFMHCKAFLPWGSRAYGDNWRDADGGTRGHLAHAHDLLWAWLIDSDPWARQGYELWLSQVQFPASGDLRQARQTNQTLLEAIWAYRYARRADLVPSIQGMLDVLIARPIVAHGDEPLWAPSWPSEAYELLEAEPALDPDGSRRAKLKTWIVESADAIGLKRSSAWSLALAAKAYEFTADPKYLTQHAATLDRMQRRLWRGEDSWAGYGLAPLIGDGHLPWQWPRFLAALRKAGIDQLDPPAEPGHYFVAQSRYNHAADIAARGSEILIAKPAGVRELAIDCGTITTYSLHAASMQMMDPAGKTVWSEPRIATEEPLVRRASSYDVYRLRRTLPEAAGVFRLKIGAHELGLFQGIAGGLPECQVLESVKIDAWSEPVRYSAQISRGYLVRRAAGLIKLRCKAAGERDGSHVTIEGPGMPRWDRWLVAGTSDEVPLLGTGPWKVDLFGDGTSVTLLEIESTSQQPLLYGADAEQVRQFLGPSGPAPRN